MSDTIYVTYSHIDYSPAYHKAIVFVRTDSSNQITDIKVIEGEPEDTGHDISNFIDDEFFTSGNEENSFGKLYVGERTGGPSDLALGREIIAEGSDLSSKWSEIEQAGSDINQEGYNYLVLYRNSNTAADDILSRVSLPATTEDQEGNNEIYWTPGSHSGVLS